MSAILTTAVLKAAAAHFGRQGGKVKTPARAAASRRNGKLGGRPPKKATA